jgi:uncharacterized protein
MDSKAILSDTLHRPWPLPEGIWVMEQTWLELLFMHWDLPPETLRPLVPAPLELDLYEGRAYVGVVPFRIEGLRPRGLPGLPGATDFPELNVRTCVRYGDRPGVFFLRLDAASGAAVLGARAVYRLPYERAEMQVRRSGEWVDYGAHRLGTEARFEARYRPNGDAYQAVAGTRDHFLTERYALYAVPGSGTVLRADIHHRPWRLQPAVAEVRKNTLLEAEGLEHPGGQPVLHYAARQETLVWLPEKVR